MSEKKRDTLVPDPIDEDLIETEDPFAAAIAEEPVDPLARAKAALADARSTRDSGKSTSEKLAEAMAAAKLRKLQREQDGD